MHGTMSKLRAGGRSCVGVWVCVGFFAGTAPARPAGASSRAVRRDYYCLSERAAKLYFYFAPYIFSIFATRIIILFYSYSTVIIARGGIEATQELVYFTNRLFH
jgi:hypothetical protein